MHVTNGIPLGCPLPLTVATVNSVQTLKVLNLSPPDLLGEVVMVDDNSSLSQLKYLEEHLDALPPAVRSKIKLVRRKVHNGIVGARNRGAEEASFPIILFLDSHAEVTPGWLEPLVAQIHEDRTRVVIPDLRSINLDRITIGTVRVF
jgi:polypeptide N-acetylgalactosaminyltransferase